MVVYQEYIMREQFAQRAKGLTREHGKADNRLYIDFADRRWRWSRILSDLGNSCPRE